MAEYPRSPRAERKAHEIQAARDALAEEIRQLAEISDDELILRTPANTSLSRPRPQMEMQRRLKDAVERLAVETIRSRESSEQLTGQLDASIARLTTERLSGLENRQSG